MNQLFQLNPALCPLAIAEIKRRCADAQRDYTAFRGLCYQVTVGGQVWHVGNRDSDPSEVCNWTDADFGFSPLVGVNTPAESLPVDTLVLTYGFGAEPVRAVILAPQRADGTYSVGREGDTSVTQTITNEDIVSVVSNPDQKRLEQAAPELLEALKALTKLVHNICGDDCNPDAAFSEMKAARAAIAKATNA